MKFYFKKSMGIMFRTFPFILLKFFAYLIITLLFFTFGIVLLYFAIKFGGIITIVIVLIGLVLVWGFVTAVRRYVLYMLKVGHIAVIAQIVRSGSIPNNQGMISYGFSSVKSKFVTSSVFFAIDAMIEAVVYGISNFIKRIGRWVPSESVRTIFDILSKIVSVFLNYIDEAILSFIFINQEKDTWKSARDGLVLYFKSWKPILATSVFVVLLNYLLTILFFILAYVITLPIAMSIGGILKDVPFILALLIAAIIKFAFLNQLTLIWIIVTYQESIKDQTPDIETMKKLEELVPEFKEITAKAGKN